VEHDGSRNCSPEEAEAVDRIVRRLLASGSTWRNSKGTVSPMSEKDILIVAPYNVHVAMLEEKLAGRGIRVGTVDRFQDQEAPVAIYSMATSCPE
jgi:uncharacterized protein